MEWRNAPGVQNASTQPHRAKSPGGQDICYIVGAYVNETESHRQNTEACRQDEQTPTPCAQAAGPEKCRDAKKSSCAGSMPTGKIVPFRESKIARDNRPG